MVDIKFDKRLPVYNQVTTYFKQKIISGEFETGQTLPSRREVATQLGINPNTVQRAYKELQDEGLIITDGNILSRVVEDQDRIELLKLEMVNQEVEQFVEKIMSIGVKEADLIKKIQFIYQKSEGANRNDRSKKSQ